MASRGRSSSISGPARGSGSGRNRTQKSTITRVRTGCFTCRKRKKKCDERKPGCGNCQKTGVVCEGFPQTVHWETRIAAKRLDEMDHATQGSNAMGYQPPMVMGEQAQNFALAYGEGNAQAFSNILGPNYGFMMEPQFGDDLDFMFDQSGGADPTFMPLVHTEAGNTSSHQSSHGLVIGDEDKTKSRRPNRMQSLVAQKSFMPTELPFLISGVESNLHRQLFCHFTGVMSLLLAITVGDSNPFNSVVIPLALRDRTVMDTILCLAGSHLVKLQQDNGDPELGIERSRLHESAVQIQQRRVQALKALSPSPGRAFTLKDQEVIFATSLLLCLYEICEGTGDDAWRIHLDMAREVITVVTENAQSPSTNAGSPRGAENDEAIVTEIDPFLLEFFLYHDSLATVTVPSLLTIQPRLQSVINLSNRDSNVVGIQDGLSDFVTRISSLRVQADASPLQPDGNIVCKAVIIWQDLARWKPKAIMSEERTLIAEFYQWALFIWLFSIVYPEGKSDEKVQSAVKRIAEGMCNIKPGKEGVMSCLLFPLFIIGSAAIKTEDRDAITAQFRRLKAWSSLGNIDLTEDIVIKMWSDHDMGLPRSWDWVRQLETDGMSFLVT